MPARGVVVLPAVPSASSRARLKMLQRLRPLAALGRGQLRLGVREPHDGAREAVVGLRQAKGNDAAGRPGAQFGHRQAPIAGRARRLVTIAEAGEDGVSGGAFGR